MNQQQNNKELMPVLFSLPTINRLNLPSRSELLPKIESGEIDHLDFQANVFSPSAKNLNPYRFNDEDMPAFAASFESQPYLRDHDTYSIDSRDGTILSSVYKDNWIQVVVSLTTRRGMTDYLEGKMDRFSIGWYYKDAICSICGNSFFSRDCSHWPGVVYIVGKEARTCILTFVEPRGKEVSAVNVPAVQGTRIKWLSNEEQPFTYFKFIREALLRMDSKARAESMMVRIQNGMMTPNEAREKDDMGAYPDGDQFYMASNISPIGGNQNEPATK
jgi:hypothetical protein